MLQKVLVMLKLYLYFRYTKRNYIRNVLDKITPESFKKVYEIIPKKLKNLGILDKFNFMTDYMLVALDGIYYHSSKNISYK